MSINKSQFPPPEPKYILNAHGSLLKDKFTVVPQGIIIYTIAAGGDPATATVKKSDIMHELVRIYEADNIIHDMNLDFNTFYPTGLPKTSFTTPGLMISNGINRPLPPEIYGKKENLTLQNLSDSMLEEMKRHSLLDILPITQTSNDTKAPFMKARLSTVLRLLEQQEIRGIIALTACKTRTSYGDPLYANLPKSQNQLDNGATPREQPNEAGASIKDYLIANYFTKFYARCNHIIRVTPSQVKINRWQLFVLQDVISSIKQTMLYEGNISKNQLAVYFKIWFFIRKERENTHAASEPRQQWHINAAPVETYNDLKQFIITKDIPIYEDAAQEHEKNIIAEENKQRSAEESARKLREGMQRFVSNGRSRENVPPSAEGGSTKGLYKTGPKKGKLKKGYKYLKGGTIVKCI